MTDGARRAQIYLFFLFFAVTFTARRLLQSANASSSLSEGALAYAALFPINLSTRADFTMHGGSKPPPYKNKKLPRISPGEFSGIRDFYFPPLPDMRLLLPPASGRLYGLHPGDSAVRTLLTS